MGDRALKVPPWLAEAAEQLAKDLGEQGFAALDEELVRPSGCPRCGASSTRSSGLHAVCSACGLPYASLEPAWSSGRFTPPGVILGLAMNALWLRRPRPSPRPATPLPPVTEAAPRRERPSRRGKKQ